jgi:hypothetical protein
LFSRRRQACPELAEGATQHIQKYFSPIFYMRFSFAQIYFGVYFAPKLPDTVVSSNIHFLT